MRRFKPEGAALAAFALSCLVFVWLGQVALGDPAAGGPNSATGSASSPSAPSASPKGEPGENPNRPPPGTIFLLLPAVTGNAGEWIAPWTNPSEAGRFTKLQDDLSARFKGLGYGVMTPGEALASPAAATALRDAPRPITPEAAASAARAARATLALVLRAEALRRREPKQVFTDAIVSAEIYRAADAVKLASGGTKVSGLGATVTEADAAALSHATPALLDALAGPLSAGVQRPVIAPRPVTVYIDGDLVYRDYRRLLGLLQHEIPEISDLQERRFSHGRQTLRVICACQPWDISQRLDGRTTGGFIFDVQSELDAVRVRARPAGTVGPPP